MAASVKYARKGGSVESLITDNLGVWSTAVKAKSTVGRGSCKKLELYGIKKLRELILELAVRGLLVPQEPKDEPASELLKIIAAEKSKLIKEGKIKKQKTPSPFSEEEELFKVPKNWSWQRLGEIGEIFNGNSINASVKERKYTNISGVPFIATKDVGYGFEKLDYKNGVAIPSGEDKFKIAKKGSVLICAEGGSAGKKCGIAEKDIYFGNKLFANVLYGSIEPKYILSLFLSPSFFERLSESMTGIIGGISSAKFIALPAPIPPLKEQRRIVAKIDDLMALCDQLEQQTEASISAHQTLVQALLESLINTSERDGFNQAWARIAEHFDTLFTTEWSIDQLKQTILQLAVMGKLVPQNPNVEPASELLKKIDSEKARLIEEGRIKEQKELLNIDDEKKPFVVPSSWKWCNLSDLFALVTDGDHQAPPKSDIGIPFLVIGNLNTGKIIFDDCKFVPEEYYQNLNWVRQPTKGDLLYTVTGSYGIPISVDTDQPFCVQRHVAIFKSLASTPRNYLSLILGSKYALEYATLVATGIAQKTVPLTGLRKMPIPVPPESEQYQIVDKVNELMSLCDKLKNRINTLQITQLHLGDAMAEHALN